MENQSEQLKKVVDDFGRLSFILESYTKLCQTGDHKELAKTILIYCDTDARVLQLSIEKLKEIVLQPELENV